MLRKSLCEALGALLLTACVVGSGIMAERLAGGNAAVAQQLEIAQRQRSLAAERVRRVLRNDEHA